MAPTILITGASHGIGKATALLFAKKGYDVVLAARTLEPLEAIAQTIRDLGVSALSVPTDTRDVQQVDSLVKKALSVYGSIDVLVNNAGICMSGPMENSSLSDWQQVIDTNLWGYIYTIHTLLPHFLERGSGTIVNVGSFGGKIPLPYMSAYCTSKYAVTGLTETLRLELEPKGIHVCGVHPSATRTDFIPRAIFRGKDEPAAQERRQQMDQLLQTPVASDAEDVAKAIWDGVQHRRSEIVVGSAAIASSVYNLFPGLMQWIMQRSAANQPS